MRILKLLSASAMTLALISCGNDAVVPAPQSVTIVAAPVVPPPPPPPPVQPSAERIIIHPDGTITSGAANSGCESGVRNGNVEQALKTGDVSFIEKEKDILTDILMTAECQRTQFNEARIKLFNLNTDGSTNTDSLNAITWNPTHDATKILPIFGESESLFISNDTWRTDGNIYGSTLAVVGQSGDSRHIVFGGHPFRTIGSANEQMHQFLRNSLAWLTQRDDLTSAPFNIVIAQHDESYWFPDYSKSLEWFTAEFSDQLEINARGVCNGNALAGCLAARPDLLIISDQLGAGEDASAIVEAVETAMQSGTPVLYMHLDGNEKDLTRALFPILKTQYAGDNYWSRQRITNFDSAPYFAQLPENIADRVKLVKRFLEFDFTINFADCDNHSCPSESNYQVQFSNTASELQAEINGFDDAGINLFKQSGQRFTKGLVLLADYYRQSARYPMDKVITPQRDFLSSLYADMVVHTARDVNAAQSDMGNFSRSDFSHVTPVTKDITLTARQHYKAAGVYALPGQTVRVTRNDNAEVNTHIKINMVRSGSTHLFDNNAYNRPKYTESRNLPIARGETMSFTSPYGGPIQIRFDAKDVEVNFTFENVGEHAIWRGPEDDLDFAAKLDAGDYDWAELITPSFQVHSKLDKMRETVADPMWGSAAAIGAATETHLHNYPHMLAGFKGVGIDVAAEVHDFAADNGLDIHTLDIVKHMNADQATCGYGCSGNPYDAYWSFNPIGHGDIHELGHGLERSRFRYTGQVGHTSTNPYSYYSKWKRREAAGNPISELGCQNLPYETLFNAAQNSRNEADPAQYMRDQAFTNWNYGAGINHQIMMAAQDLGLLTDGRLILARLHVIEREFNIADDNDTDWAAKRNGLGFGSFTRDEARALSNNDWNLIALSHALNRNMTNYLELWGFELSQAAKTHVAAWNYDMMPTDFYTVPSNQHCGSFDSLPKLPIDGKQLWPTTSQKPLTPIEDQKAAEHICTHDEDH